MYHLIIVNHRIERECVIYVSVNVDGWMEIVNMRLYSRSHFIYP